MTEPPRDEPFDPNQVRWTPQPSGYPAQGQPAAAGWAAHPAQPAPSAASPRLLRRPEPRFGVAIAALGALLTIFGVLVLASSAGGSLGSGGDGSQGHQILGLILSLVVAVAGYALTWSRPSGPLSAAGVAASALAVLAALGFAFTLGHASSTTLVKGALPIAIVVWLVSYWLPARSRGHVFYLGAALVGLWLWIVVLLDSNAFLALFFAPFVSIRPALGDQGVFYGSGFATADFTSVAALSIILGLVYYAAAYLFGRAGRAGVGVAFAVAGVPSLVAGLAFAAVKAPQVLEGVLIVVLSLAVAALGARTGRRFTTWFWTLGVGVGIVVLLEKAVGDDDTAAGISLIVIGVALTVLAPLLAAALRETDETQPTPPVPST